MKNSLKLKSALASMLGLAVDNAPEERPRYPFAMGEKYDAKRKSPSHTKKGPGRRHMSGRRKHGGKS